MGAATSVPLKTKAEALEDYKIYQILQECKTIPGPVRYVAVTAGGVVLETAGIYTPAQAFRAFVFRTGMVFPNRIASSQGALTSTMSALMSSHTRRTACS